MQSRVILILLIYCTEKNGVRNIFHSEIVSNCFLQIITIKKAIKTEFKLDIFRKTE